MELNNFSFPEQCLQSSIIIVLPPGISFYSILMSSADNFCKQFGPRSGLTERRDISGSKLFDTLIVFLKELFEKVDFEKSQQTTKNVGKFPRGQRVNKC